MRLVFLGTPDFAVPVLDKLVSVGFEIAAVISQPDREKDKKGNLLATPVKRYAESHGLTCLQFDKVSQHVEELKSLAPDVMVTVAYGQILSREVLAVPRFGVLNVHASLLPKYRGSSPIQSAILCGERVTGVTIMKTDIGMDTGDIVAVREVSITPADNSATLSDKLAAVGADLLARVLPDYASGKITPVPQKHEETTACKKIAKADGLIDWTLSAREIACKVRAYNPWPIAFTYLDGVMLKIYGATECDETLGKPGTVYVSGDTVKVACGKGSLVLDTLQLPGKRVLPACEFARGRKNLNGSVLKNE